MDVEKTIQFLLEQQARFDARQAQFDDRQARFDEDFARINAVLLDVATAQEGTNRIVATLAERHVELAESHKALVDAHKATEQTLHALVSIVEHHITSPN